MCRCNLCWCITQNEADFEISFGSNDRLLRVCKWCEQDLILFGVKLNQIVRLEASRHVRRIAFRLVVLGPVYTLLEASS